MLFVKAFYLTSVWHSVRRFDARLPFTMSLYRRGLKRGLRALSQRRRVRMACKLSRRGLVHGHALPWPVARSVTLSGLCDAIRAEPMHCRLALLL